MTLDRDIEDTRQPNYVYYATCEICGEVRDLSDMQEVGGDVWVCDGDCFDVWVSQNTIEVIE